MPDAAKMEAGICTKSVPEGGSVHNALPQSGGRETRDATSKVGSSGTLPGAEKRYGSGQEPRDQVKDSRRLHWAHAAQAK